MDHGGRGCAKNYKVNSLFCKWKIKMYFACADVVGGFSLCICIYVYICLSAQVHTS